MRLLIAATGLACVTSHGAMAQNFDDLTDAGRLALREEIRSYLLEQPEVLLEAMEALEASRTDQFEGALFDDETSWSGGNPQGDLRMVEFIDYRCGYCKKSHPEISELIESDGEIRIIRKEFPVLGPESEQAARYAIAVLQTEGDAAYEQVSNQMMSMPSAAISSRSFIALTEERGADWPALQRRMNQPEVTEVIAKNRALGRELGLTGTPAFVIEDQVIGGYLPLARMKERVAAARDASDQ